MSVTSGGDVPDGPWRVSSRLRVVILSEVADAAADEIAAALGAALATAGLAVIDRSVMTAEAAAGLLRPETAADCDLLLLDAATHLDPAGVAALRRAAASDPMILAVSPRFAATAAAVEDVGRRAVDYAVLADPRCLYVKGSILATFGTGPRRDPGPEPEPAGIVDLLLRFNRFGFRVAVANHVLALHPAGDEPPRVSVVAPAWQSALAHHLASAPRLAETLMAGLRPDACGRLAVAFDLTHIEPRHSGTTRLARALLGRAVARWRDLSLHVVASQEAFAFHFADLAGALQRIDPDEGRCFAAVIRFGQPFLWQEIDAAARRAPVLVLFMLDTIGLDCLQHAPDELDALWRFVFAEADGVLFNSGFTERQFARRFTIRPGLPRRASLHSLRLSDYRDEGAADAGPADDTILVVGNGFPHKHLAETAALLGAAGLAETVVALGLEAGRIPGVVALASGDLASERLAALYAAARIVVYPSVYEGFGFPILEALAHRRPILVRPLPPYVEIAAGLPEAANIHFYHDDADLVRRLRDPPAWIEPPAAPAPVRDWNHAADDLREVLEEALAAADVARVVRRIDILRGRMAYMRARAFAAGRRDEVAVDRLERAAGLAGRIARTAVLTLGRRAPGLPAVLALAGRLARPTGGRRR